MEVPKAPRSRAATSWRHYRPETLVIAHLRGRIFDKQPNRILVDVNGVGYDVAVPLSTFYGLGDAGRRDRASHPHARARGRAAAVRVCDQARTGAVRAPDLA